MPYRIRIALQNSSFLMTAVSLFVVLAVHPAFTPEQQRRPLDKTKISFPRLSNVKEADPAARNASIESYDKLPLSFEANKGQIAEDVKFYSRGAGYSLFLTPTEAVFSLKPKSKVVDKQSQLRQHEASRAHGETIRMQLIAANPSPKITGLDELPGKSNYFIGNDPSKWRTDVPQFAKVKIADVYHGIDLVYYGNQRQLEYDWIVAPGADANAIKFTVKTEGKLKVDSEGNLAMDKNGHLLMRKPFVYQEQNGVRTQIAAGYALKSQGQIGFYVDRYDAALPLVIDPVLVYSTYLGGSEGDESTGIAVDSSGAVYLTGRTESSNFPTANPLQTSHSFTDAFITKLNASGNALVYSTYLGGGFSDCAYSVAVDSSGAVYLTGGTESSDFPTVNPFQASFRGSGEAFVTKLNASGNALVYSTYLGGSGGESGIGIAVDSYGDAYITGRTDSSNFPTANPFQASNGGGFATFITKLNASGNALVYSTYLNGCTGYGIAVDSSGAAYVTGYTGSLSLPTVNPFQASCGGSFDAFIAKLNASGDALVYSTYLGGSKYEMGYGIAVDSSGAAYVTGITESTNFPAANPFQASHGGGVYDAFVTKLNASGNALAYSTYLGGNGYDEGRAIAVDSYGDAYITGFTLSRNFPEVYRSQIPKGGWDSFVTRLDGSGTAIVYSTHLGGDDHDQAASIAVDSIGAVYVTGYTKSTNFPKANPIQPSKGGDRDLFVTKIEAVAQAVLEITMSKSNYITGDVVTASVFRLKNKRPATLGELKVWLSIPEMPPIGIINLGADGSFAMPADFNLDFGPIALFTVVSALPRGIYEFSSSILEPITNQLLGMDENKFTIQ